MAVKGNDKARERRRQAKELINDIETAKLSFSRIKASSPEDRGIPDIVRENVAIRDFILPNQNQYSKFNIPHLRRPRYIKFGG